MAAKDVAKAGSGLQVARISLQIGVVGGFGFCKHIGRVVTLGEVLPGFRRSVRGFRHAAENRRCFRVAMEPLEALHQLIGDLGGLRAQRARLAVIFGGFRVPARAPYEVAEREIPQDVKVLGEGGKRFQVITPRGIVVSLHEVSVRGLDDLEGRRLGLGFRGARLPRIGRSASHGNESQNYGAHRARWLKSQELTPNCFDTASFPAAPELPGRLSGRWRGAPPEVAALEVFGDSISSITWTQVTMKMRVLSLHGFPGQWLNLRYQLFPNGASAFPHALPAISIWAAFGPCEVSERPSFRVFVRPARESVASSAEPHAAPRSYL